MKILENRTVGPSLGEDSIRLGPQCDIAGMVSGVLGMAIYYKWSGMVADVALMPQSTADFCSDGVAWIDVPH